MNQRGNMKNEDKSQKIFKKEMRTISETSRTVLNAPAFETQESQKKKTKRKDMKKSKKPRESQTG